MIGALVSEIFSPFRGISGFPGMPPDDSISASQPQRRMQDLHGEFG